ncbi:hypothetical protein DFH06DRAFT_601833 [Mycena polygramma]|nr:hypothetical protein DFH06DRAFT_601833 [Mycena polygramma]
MHPALRFSNVERLPLSSRRVVTAVCGRHPSHSDMAGFAALMDALRARKKLVDLLPAFYQLLDPAGIPRAAELDGASPGMLRTIDLALLSLSGLWGFRSPPEAGKDLWPRALAWVQFGQLFRDFLSEFPLDQLGMPDEEELCFHFMTFTRDMSYENSNAVMINSTQGLKALAARTWVCMLKQQNPSLLVDALYSVFPFLSNATSGLEEIVEGAGGTLDDVAAHIMDHFTLVLPPAGTALSLDQRGLLESVLAIWVRLDGMYETTTLAPNKPLSLALISRGVVKPFTLTVWSLSLSTTPDSVRALEECLKIYATVLPMRSQGVRVAVQNGIIPALLTCARRGVSDQTRRLLSFLLEQVITPATVSCYVLADVDAAISALEDIPPPDSSCGMEFVRAWASLERTTLHRLEVLRVFDSPDHISRRACDNVQCGKIQEKRSLKRCSGCRELLYCSQECQRLDWRRGHRDVCAQYLNAHTDIHSAYNSRERAFLRALLNYDHNCNRIQVYRNSAVQWSSSPNAELVTVFDYCSSEVAISVRVLTSKTAELIPQVQHWPDIVARAGASAGRMALGIVLLRDGNKRREWVVPLRMATSAVRDRVKAIACSGGSSDPGVIHERVKFIRPAAEFQTF